MRGWSGTSLKNKFLTVSNKFKEHIMKKLILAAGLMLAIAYPTAYAAEEKAPETKKICVDIQGKDGKPVIDPKTKKPKQDCKEVKIRKKHEGTKIEDAKKDTGKK